VIDFLPNSLVLARPRSRKIVSDSGTRQKYHEKNSVSIDSVGRLGIKSMLDVKHDKSPNSFFCCYSSAFRVFMYVAA
jgi:hypothetical protein